MQAARPRYVLIAETEPATAGAVWRFALHNAETGDTVAACDSEPGDSTDRQELMAVVRGLEALDQPSSVTLVTRSRTVLHGVTRGLAAWRNAHWRWERFGRMVPIRHADLWRRIDRAMSIHEVECRSWRVDTQTSEASEEGPSLRKPSVASPSRPDRFDSPAMVIVPSHRSRRVVRLSEPKQRTAVAC